jgi:hypothetical protein
MLVWLLLLLLFVLLLPRRRGLGQHCCDRQRRRWCVVATAGGTVARTAPRRPVCCSPLVVGTVLVEVIGLVGDDIAVGPSTSVSTVLAVGSSNSYTPACVSCSSVAKVRVRVRGYSGSTTGTMGLLRAKGIEIAVAFVVLRVVPALRVWLPLLSPRWGDGLPRRGSDEPSTSHGVVGVVVTQFQSCTTRE